VDLEEIFLVVARLIRRGEWTTYGDISAAATGTMRLARAVGRAAATLDDFPNAHRVLAAGGRVTRGRRSHAAAEAARARLEREGVTFARDRADPSRRVHWDELARRCHETDSPNPSIGHRRARH
jgi:alkylated DNA nucleotide flippase Atl1